MVVPNVPKNDSRASTPRTLTSPPGDSRHHNLCTTVEAIRAAAGPFRPL